MATCSQKTQPPYLFVPLALDAEPLQNVARWKEIQQREAEVKKMSKNIKQMTKEFEKLRNRLESDRRNFQMARKQEQINKVQEELEAAQASLAVLKGTTSSKPFLRQATIKKTIPFHSPTKAAPEPEAAAGLDPDAGPSGLCQARRVITTPAQSDSDSDQEGIPVPAYPATMVQQTARSSAQGWGYQDTALPQIRIHENRVVQVCSTGQKE